MTNQLEVVEINNNDLVENPSVWELVEIGSGGPFPVLNSLPEKATIVDADIGLLEDSAASWARKKFTFANLITYFGGSFLKRSASDFQAFTQKISPVVSDSVLGEDSEDGESKKRITLTGIYNLFIGLLNLVFQPISTALSKITEAGGLPLWDGGAWPGGGGGGEWTDIGPPVVAVDAASIEFTGLDNTYKQYRIKCFDFHLDFAQNVACEFQILGTTWVNSSGVYDLTIKYTTGGSSLSVISFTDNDVSITASSATVPSDNTQKSTLEILIHNQADTTSRPFMMSKIWNWSGAYPTSTECLATWSGVNTDNITGFRIKSLNRKHSGTFQLQGRN